MTKTRPILHVIHGALSITLVLLSGSGSPCLAQDYECDWNVVGIAGGDMSSTNYRCGSTVGQTAAGQLTGAAYWALIGFWQVEDQVGIREAAEKPVGEAIQTRLHVPAPNPFGSRVAIRYSLAAPGPASLQVYDRIGRLVRSWAVSRGPSAVSSVTWDGRDARGRLLANGIYFCRMNAGDYQGTHKLVLQQ